MKSEFIVCYNDATHLGDSNYVVSNVKKLLRIYDEGDYVTYGEDPNDTLTVTQLRNDRVFTSIDVVTNKFWEILTRWVWFRLRELVTYERYLTKNEKCGQVIVKVTVEVGESIDEGHSITLTLGKESFSLLTTRKVTEEVFFE